MGTWLEQFLKSWSVLNKLLKEDGMKKGIFLIAMGLAMISCGIAKAEEAPAPQMTVYGMDVKAILSNTRAGVFLPFEGGRSYKTIYTPLVWVHDSAGVEYAAIDVGAAAPGDMTKGFAMLGLGLRLDNILDRAIGISKWSRAHVGSAVLPTLELSVASVFVENKFKHGVNVAFKF